MVATDGHEEDDNDGGDWMHASRSAPTFLPSSRQIPELLLRLLLSIVEQENQHHLCRQAAVTMKGTVRLRVLCAC